MDDVQRMWYGMRFKLAFLEKKETAFQDFFARLANHAWGPDFEQVRPYGAQGDFKCDGRRLSTGTIFQCYAPHHTLAYNLETKITNDFTGAVKHWPRMEQWVFVFNDPLGLPPTTSQLLDKLRANTPAITLQVWNDIPLQAVVAQLPIHACEDLFGYAPSRIGVESLAMDDIQPVIAELAELEPAPGQDPVTPPSFEKLERNALSEDAAGLLRLGRRKEALVEAYFTKTPTPDLGDRIAGEFRRRYADLKAAGLSADSIFGHLQAYAGAGNLPKTQAAALAVLSYYFERCDIFEDPPEPIT